MKTLYCDEDIIVCIKPAGVVSTDEPGGMPELIRKSLGKECMVRTVHRLDSVVSGLMVYALSKEAASGLSEQMENGIFGKEYLAVVEGRPEKDQGELRDYLLRNKRERKTYVSDRRNRNAQEAILTYQTCGTVRKLSLVRVKLITGRTHQIRCQFSSRKLPLYGDRKYGSLQKDAKIALWSYHLSFRHPITGKTMNFFALPPMRTPWNLFQSYTESYEEQDLEVEFQRSEVFSDCPYAEDCRFCSYQGMEYEKQLEKKQRKNSRWIKEMGLEAQILAAEEPFGYRNKITIDYGLDKNGSLVSGIYSRKLHKVVRIGKCRIDHPKLSEIAGTLRSLLIRYQIPIYDEQKNSGWMKQATLRITTAGEVMVVLRAVADPIPEVLTMAEELERTHLEIKSILLERKEKNGKAQKEPQVLRGNAYLNENWMGQAFQIHPDSFFPLNPPQSQKVYETALESAALSGEERVLDVSCGVGVLSLAAATHAKRVLAVDASETALKEAKERARKSNAENIRFVSAEPEIYLDTLARSHEKIDVLFTEASRCRNTKDCIAALGKLKPQKIIYIGRDAETMGLDMHTLTGYGYQIQKVQMVDMMPFTEHVETVCLLSNRKADAKIRIDVDLEDYYAIKDAKKSQN